MYPAANYRLLIRYDGRPFCGWQRQPNGRSIQQCLEEACGRLCGGECKVDGAGRTDAGVHAAGQVACVRMAARLSTAEIKRAMNASLPPEIRVTAISRAEPDFHARKHARQKTYRYLIITGRRRSPFAPFYATWLPQRLDLDRMREAARYLTGRHDFKSFQAAGSSVKGTIRNLSRLEIKSGGGMISITAAADGFLRHMVRNIVGTLIEVGRGKLEPEEMGAILAGVDRKLAGPTAPAEGLTLLRVDY
jgi:tRNA pseudouridine38-40 synthase